MQTRGVMALNEEARQAGLGMRLRLAGPRFGRVFEAAFANVFLEGHPTYMIRYAKEGGIQCLCQKNHPSVKQRRGLRRQPGPQLSHTFASIIPKACMKGRLPFLPHSRMPRTAPSIAAN